MILLYPERTPHLLRGKSKDLSQRDKDPSVSSFAKASEDESLGISVGGHMP